MEQEESKQLGRRGFLQCLGTSAAGALLAKVGYAAPKENIQTYASDWNGLRKQFELSPDLIHFSSFLLASHPKPVRDAIEGYRKRLDREPTLTHGTSNARLENEVRLAAAEYLSAHPSEIALTDSTTQGLSLVYMGLRLKEGQEFLTTEHDHFSTHEAVRIAAERSGATVRRVRLYQASSPISEEQIVQVLISAVKPSTRVLALTWVHSCSGVKLPIRKISEQVARLNERRAREDQIILCVDGVHALGIEDFSPAELGCTFFVAGCHKSLFGPRGTGIVWAKAEGWSLIQPLIPGFSDDEVWEAWMEKRNIPPTNSGVRVTPGGFHSFEHRWALADAFRFQQRLGKSRVTARIRELNAQCKEGMRALPGVRVHTPLATELSAGMICFEVRDIPAREVSARLLKRKIVAVESPYLPSYARVAPGVLNTSEEVEKLLKAIREI